MRIAIIGSGAVGLYYGGRLQRSGQDVHFLLRSGYQAIRRSGIRIRASDASFQVDEVNAYLSTEEIGIADLVIVSVKSTSNADLPGLIAPLVGPGTNILTFQNGLGNAEFLRRSFPSCRILAGACFVCLNQVSPGVVENHYLGSVIIGGWTESEKSILESVVAVFRDARIQCRPSLDPETLLWEKLLWNVPFNGLSIAAGEVTTDVVLSTAALKMIARGLMEEIVAGARALGMEIDPDLIDRLLEETKTMGDYRPSSLVDYSAGKPVELESIWGEPLRRSLEAGAEVPKLETLYRLLRILCERRYDAS